MSAPKSLILPRRDGYYTVDGTPYVSVTTALSVIREPHLERWRGDVGNAEADFRRDSAGELGSLVHQIIAEGREDQDTDHAELDRMLLAYREWAEMSLETVLARETTVIHRGYQYAGTLDMLAVLKGDTLPSVIDFKTGVESPVAALQLAAYAEAVRDSGTPTVREQGIGRRLALYLRKGADAGKWAVREFNDPADFRRFTYAMDLWRWRNER